MKANNYLVYLIALPLFSAALLLLLGRIADKWGHLLATLVSASTFAIGAYEFFAMRSRSGVDRAITQHVIQWISVGTLKVDGALLLVQL